MKVFNLLSVTALLFLGNAAYCQSIVSRGDDIGSFHSANLAVIDSYKNGFEKVAEVMVVTSWFPEAVKMLKENPGLDVGVHVALTSEWENVKWRPLTNCPSLTDKDGYFYPCSFPNDNYPGQSLIENKDKINWIEFENEVRAQVALAKKNLPNISHISAHMVWTMVSPQAVEITKKICNEFNILYVEGKTNGVEVLPMPIPYGIDPKLREKTFIECLDKLEKGKTYLFIDHPAYATNEMESVFHIGYENVAQDRQSVADLFMSKKVKSILDKKGIKLINYKQAFGKE